MGGPYGSSSQGTTVVVRAQPVMGGPSLYSSTSSVPMNHLAASYGPPTAQQYNRGTLTSNPVIPHTAASWPSHDRQQQLVNSALPGRAPATASVDNIGAGSSSVASFPSFGGQQVGKAASLERACRTVAPTAFRSYAAASVAPNEQRQTMTAVSSRPTRQTDAAHKTSIVLPPTTPNKLTESSRIQTVVREYESLLALERQLRDVNMREKDEVQRLQ